jgi:hypothetical protein
MGFKLKRPQYRLVFEGTDFEGLEVVCRSASVAAYQEIAALAQMDTANMSTLDLERIDFLFKAFGEVLLSWNLEEEIAGIDVPVPATADGLKSQDLPFALMIIRSWMDAVANVDLDFTRADADAGLLSELPMEVLPGL